MKKRQKKNNTKKRRGWHLNLVDDIPISPETSKWLRRCERIIDRCMKKEKEDFVVPSYML